MIPAKFYLPRHEWSWVHVDPRVRRGFTLIELLIVIAIILILISIALPNFLEAQMRARVVKVKAEIRSIALAMEQYYLDFKLYPAESEDYAGKAGRLHSGLFWLTSPIKYLSKVPEDPFINHLETTDANYYETGGVRNARPPCTDCLVTWVIFTRGPDLQENQIPSAAPHCSMYDDNIDSYSPTNGSKSIGDIFQYGGDPRWIGVNTAIATVNPYTCAQSPIRVDWEIYHHRLPPKLR